MIADSIKIETDEDGFHLIVEAPEEDGAFFKQRRFDFRIDDPEALYDAVRAEIGPWLREREHARLAFLCVPDESAGLDSQLGRPTMGDHEDEQRRETAYGINDPKHPDFHSVHADIYDAVMREEKS